MQNPLQEVLPASVTSERDSIEPDATKRSNDGVAGMGSQAFWLSMIAGLLPAIAAICVLAGHYEGKSGDLLSLAGCGLMIWAAATMVVMFSTALCVSRRAELWCPAPTAPRRHRPNERS